MQNTTLAVREAARQTNTRPEARRHARPTPIPPAERRGSRHALPSWAAGMAAVWSLAYGVLGVYWSMGGPGFPYGANDPSGGFSKLSALRTETAAPAIAVLGLIGAVVGVMMAWSPRRGPARALLLGTAWTYCATLLLVVPDARLLATIAYAPIFLLGWPPIRFLDAVPWPVRNQAFCLAGGFVWGCAALWYQRRARGACAGCGRTDATPASWTTPTAAARWGRWAVVAAMLLPLGYATTRIAWALGIPLGITEEFLRLGQEEGLWLAGVALATVDLVGATLTLGLAQRWGEVFPGWLPGLAGRRVPPMLAIVPATVVATIVTAAGLSSVLHFIAQGFPAEGWATTGPGLLWPLWGVTLAAATLAYAYRRRGRCQWCGRDPGTSIESGGRDRSLTARPVKARSAMSVSVPALTCAGRRR